MKKLSVNFLFLCSFLLINACSSAVRTEENKTDKIKLEEKQLSILPPEELYGELFFDVQENESLFADSKTFVDAVPRMAPREIQKKYAEEKPTNNTEFKAFLNENFEIPALNSEYKTDSSSINLHINKLWDVLKRPADEQVSGTLIPLPNPYIVPGGRFREIYYWDSYFTMLGLQEDGETETIRNMVDNFAWLIENYGFIPNGNRTYYLSRSQPPFFAKMVQLLAEIEGEEVYIKYLPALQKEYDFWMKGSENQEPGAYKRVVKLSDGEILNRYWDDKNTPRPESYREDVETAEEAITKNPDRSKAEVYRDLRAAAESGWDFSSRWLSINGNGDFNLYSIHTTQIIPVDLNSLLYNLEKTLARAYKLDAAEEKAEVFRIKAENRKIAIQKYLWEEETGFYFDYNFKKAHRTGIYSLAGVYPLFFKISEDAQTGKVAKTLEQVFLRPGGLVSTPHNTGQQWDAPNGWAPLQYMSIEGLRNYNKDYLASEIKQRWLNLNQNVYENTYKLLEKYNVEDLSKESGGGEYPTQDGFGWTNGVYQKLSKEK
ncbi:alpha,alpha-trehalase TreF [Salegentibacter salegens]|uniref:Alpha,alpha-trehalase n=1 Tax=Salegentibacter salegens TaxID=143223 RepID=A0A1M7KES5_9FLAO|nr:alpha,alpha-trehalase TreF [Salegentibacter salegens]PRX49622.1 alpha,alpha-trehalase [Salegentibacter salegens]SHM63759.1 alpha,alpha-trehalase [Salegentibacter salegens]